MTHQRAIFELRAALYCLRATRRAAMRTAAASLTRTLSATAQTQSDLKTPPPPSQHPTRDVCTFKTHHTLGRQRPDPYGFRTPAPHCSTRTEAQLNPQGSKERQASAVPAPCWWRPPRCLSLAAMHDSQRRTTIEGLNYASRHSDQVPTTAARCQAALNRLRRLQVRLRSRAVARQLARRR
jgi:hypothetical protein